MPLETYLQCSVSFRCIALDPRNGVVYLKYVHSIPLDKGCLSKGVYPFLGMERGIHGGEDLAVQSLLAQK